MIMTLIILLGPWVLCGFLHVRVKELEKWRAGKQQDGNRGL